MAILFHKVLCLYLCFSCLCSLSATKSTDFKISRFDTNTTEVLFQGDAKLSVGAIEFNSVAYVCRVGWAHYAKRVRLWDSNTGQVSDFSTKFKVNIDTQGTGSYGQGFTFFLAPVGSQIPPNSGGGFLGLFNTSNSFSPSNQIILVEFDTYNNPEWDPDNVQGHIGINNNTISSAVYTSWNASFHSDDPADVQINYNATLKNLSVSWTYQTTINASEKSSLSYIIDLSKVLPEWVMIGFSAATGSFMERHTLTSWEFSSSLDVKESNGNTTQKSKIIGSVTGSMAGLILVGMFIVAVFMWRRKKTQKDAAEAKNLFSMNDDLERGAGPRKFSHKDLALATNNFSDERKLGEGGFGAVYRGHLNDLDLAIAVKRISRGSKQGRKEYVTEIKVISQLRHRNLVQLIGWCHDKGEFSLVYEYMPNGSLDFHLFGRKKPISWVLRHKISLGIASGILYLHEEWEQCVLHRDIKSSNIMLDSSFNAKLGDFGLAKLMDHELGASTTGLAGTLGYLAPEYISTGRASKGSDVYSFGVVALEIATGRRANGTFDNPKGLVEWVWDLYGKEQVTLGADEKLNSDLDEKQVECLMIVGLWCAHPDCTLRPSIRQAIQVLNFETALPNLPPTMPVPQYQVPARSSGGSGEPLVSYSSIDVGR